MFSSDEESETDTDEDDIIDAAFMDVLRQKRTSSRGAGKPAPRDEGVDKDNQGSGRHFFLNSRHYCQFLGCSAGLLTCSTSGTSRLPA